MRGVIIIFNRENVTYTAGIYYYITTESDYAKRDSRLAEYGDVVL